MIRKKEKNTEDVKYIIDNLRTEDFEELKALWGENWREETIENIMQTPFSVLIGASQKPVVMGGIWGDRKSEIACVWLLSTNEFSKYKTSLLKEIKKEVEKSEYKVLYNFIYKTNYEAKKWLKHLGFKFDNPFPDAIKVKKGFEFFYRIKEEK